MRINNDSYAAFGQASFKVTPEFSVTAGIRYTRDEKFFSTDQSGSFSGVPYLIDPNSSLNFDNVAPRLALEYRITPDVLTYASVSRGFKSGGANGRYTSPQPEPLPFRPEKVTAYEVGLKSEWLDRRLRVNAAAFYTDYSDIQVTVLVGSTPFNQNAAKSKIKGFELEITALPAQGLQFNFGAGYLDAKFDRVDPGSLVAKGNSLVDSPEWSLNAAIDYRYPLANDSAITARVDWAYRSRTEKDAVNSPLLSQPAYHLMNARLGFSAPEDQWNVSAFVNNLTNERYIANGFADRPNFGFSSAIFNRPREWGLSATFNF
jgi:iron complex outermembrane recepter protein